MYSKIYIVDIIGILVMSHKQYCNHNQWFWLAAILDFDTFVEE